MSDKAWRTLLQVERVINTEGEPMVIARIPARGRDAVHFPLALIPREMRTHVCSRQPYLFAMVNFATERAEDLRFSDFELAPKPVTL